jgi:hypothetical protein
MFHWIYLIQEFDVLLLRLNRMSDYSIVQHVYAISTGYKFHFII